MATKQEIKLKINADVKAAKQNIQDLRAETDATKDSIGAFGVTWGSVKQTFGKFKTIAVNGLKVIRTQAKLSGLAFKQMFSGQVTKGAKTLFAVIKAGVAATGIGLLVVAIASLVQYFKDSEEGASKFKEITAALGVVMGNLTDVLSDLGKALFEAFENPKQAVIDLGNLITENITNRMTGALDAVGFLGSAFKSLFDGDWAGLKQNIADVGESVVQTYTGVDDLYGKLKEGSDEFIEQTKIEMAMAARLQRDRLKLQQFERGAMVSKAKAERDMMELRLKARDEEKFTTEERIVFMREANEMAEAQLKKDMHVAKEKLRMQTEMNSYSKSSQQNLDDEAQLKAEVFRIEKANFSERKRMKSEEQALVNQQAALDKATAEREQKLIDDRAAKNKEAYKILRDLQNENFLASINDAKERAHAELRLQKDKELQSIMMYENFAELKHELDKKYIRLHAGVKADEAAITQAAEDMKVATITNGIDAAKSLAGDHKGLAVAQATIDTYSAVTGALSDKSTPSATLRFVNAAAMGVMGLANVQKILSTDVGSGGGGGSAPNVPSQAPAQQFSSGAFELSGGSTQDTVQAFVISDDVTTSQDRLASIRRRATI